MNAKNRMRNTDLIQEMVSDEFINFCRQKIIPALKPLESQREFYIVGAIIIGILGAIFCLWMLFYIVIPSLTTNSKNADDLIYGFFAAALGFNWLVYRILKHYKTKAKQVVFDKLFSYWGNFKYFPKIKDYNDRNEAYIHDLKLFSSFNQYDCDDFISGEYNGLKMDIQELDLKYVTGSGRNRRVIQIFKGVLVISSCNKKFDGKTIVSTDKGILNSLNGIAGLKNVKLEDPVFEKYFEVYSTDQIEARYLLTSAFMNRLVKCARKSKDMKIMCSFEHGKINLAFANSKDWFEVPVTKPVTDIRNYQSVLLELATILSVIDALKLEDNIGL